MTPFHDYFGISWYVFLIIWSAIAIGAHVYQVGFIVKLIRLGKDDDRFNSWNQRMKEFLTDWLGQRKVVEDTSSWICACSNFLGIFNACKRCN